MIRYVCVNDEHPLAGEDIQYQAPNSQSSEIYFWELFEAEYTYLF